MLNSAYQFGRKVYLILEPDVSLVLTTNDLVLLYGFIRQYKMGSHEDHKTAKDDTMYH